MHPHQAVKGRRKAILNGLRVIDLTMGWAGPLTAMLLADFGAEVIKIESTSRLDWFRGADFGSDPEDRPYEKSFFFNSVGRNKYGCTLDLTDPRGMRILKHLISVSDVMVENYAARVIENFRLTYDVVREINPSLIMVSMQAFGRTGPWRDFLAVGATIESLSGLTGLTGYRDGTPILASNAYGDPVNGYGGAIGVLMALVHRRRTGEGQYIELSQQELTVHHVAQSLIDHSLNRRVRGPQENRHPWMAPHGVYPCKGEDVWIAIAVASDEEWRGLRKVLGEPQALADRLYSDTIDRYRNQEQLDITLSGLISKRDRAQLIRQLEGAGVPCAPVNSNAEALEDSQIRARANFVRIDREHVGEHPYSGVTVRLNGNPGIVNRPAPTLGQHNQYLLGELMGLSENEIESLERDRVVGQLPNH